MTKEDLEKEAEECFKNLDDCKTKELMIEAYLAGALPREKRIEELEAQIEKMKNCYNCAGYYTEQCSGCEDYSNWELRR